MADEQNTGGQNLWLLFVSLGLGLVVVIIYNVHMNSVRNAARGETIELLQVTREMKDGDIIKAEDLQPVRVPKAYEGSLGTVVPGNNKDFAVGQSVNCHIEKGRWLLWEYITGGVGVSTVGQPGTGNVAITIRIHEPLGNILRPNARVNIMGEINGKIYRIIKGVRVLGVGGRKAADDGNRSRSASPPTNYRSIQVELPEKVALQWWNIAKHINGECDIELRPPGERKTDEFNKIDDKELLKYAEGPQDAPPAGGAGMGPGRLGGSSGVGVGVGGSKTWE